MSNDDNAKHFVSTMNEALAIVNDHDHFFILNCGCRERHGPCKRSRKDVCLWFDVSMSGGSNKDEADRDAVDQLFKEAKEKHLIPRPFRNDGDPSKLDGICFCCDDCCSYFRGDEFACDKGAFIEATNTDLCDHCGACAVACHFGAREVDGDALNVDPDKCYGCGLCVDVCSMSCIKMVPRA